MQPGFLVSHRGALGDWLLTWPLLSALRWGFPRHRFIGLGRPAYMKLAARFGLLETWKDCEAAGWLPFYDGRSLPQDLRECSHALLWTDPCDAGGLAGQLESCGFLQFALHAPRPAPGGLHAVRHHLSVLEKFQLPVPEQFTLALAVPALPKRLILIHPGSGGVDKNYHPQFYAFLADELTNRGFPWVTIVLGPAESGLDGLYAGFNVLRPTLDELPRLLAETRLYVGNDSGVTHLAALSGVRTLALYKSTSPKTWGAVGGQCLNLEAPTEEIAMARIQKALAEKKL